MARRRQHASSPSSAARHPQPARTAWRWLIGVAGIVMLLVLGRVGVGAVARWAAVQALEAGAVFDAQGWVATALRVDSHDARAELIRAACLRHLQQLESWSHEVERARGHGAPARLVEREIRLANMSLGDLQDEGRSLVGEGVAAADVFAALVLGYLSREEPEQASRIVDGWARAAPDDVRHVFLQGVIDRWLSRPARAEAAFRDVIDRRPRHDLARIALARLLEQQDRLTEACAAYETLSVRAPRDAAVALGLPRVLRKLGQPQRAAALLREIVGRPDAPSGAEVELGLAELECGDAAAAEGWLADRPAGPDEPQRLIAAATTAAARGDSARAATLFEQADASTTRSARLHDLRIRTLLDPADTTAAGKLRSLSQEAVRPGPAADAPGGCSPLFVRHCGGCHGRAADGMGPSARYLFPRPRNLRHDSFRLTSSSNGAAGEADIRGVIRNGIPGTSMPAHTHLTAAEVDALVAEVQEVVRRGLRERLVAQALQAGLDVPDEDELGRIEASRLTPRAAIVPVEFGAADPACLERGRRRFLESGCQGCHGTDGVGQIDVVVCDERGERSRPRDLVREPYKGGAEPDMIFRRIRWGMPGSGHPACPTLDDAAVVDLVHYCRSLAREPKRVLTNHEREQCATVRAYREAFPGNE